MAAIKKSALVPYTSLQMFELVNAIEEYPQFLPWCRATVVHSRDDEMVRASMVIAKGGMQYQLTTLNRLHQYQKIEISLLEGPFKHLEGFWLFEKVTAEKCQVSFEIELEFLNQLVSLTMGPILQRAAGSLVDSFCNRAAIRYGQSKSHHSG